MSVSKGKDGTWGYTCGRTSGCGGDAGSFTSSGWSTKTLAATRGGQHEAEHEQGRPMPSLAEFRKTQKVES